MSAPSKYLKGGEERS